VLVSRREWICMSKKQHHRITRMSVSRLREATIRRHTASMARALTWLRNTSPDCVAQKSASIITSRERIYFATQESSCRRDTAASRMGIK
jgi:hypothetical protein